MNLRRDRDDKSPYTAAPLAWGMNEDVPVRSDTRSDPPAFGRFLKDDSGHYFFKPDSLGSKRPLVDPREPDMNSIPAVFLLQGPRSYASMYGYQHGGETPASDLCSPASFMTASSPATFMSARSTYNSPTYVSASGYSPAMRIEAIREDEPPEPGLSAPLAQLHEDYYTSLHRERDHSAFR